MKNHLCKLPLYALVFLLGCGEQPIPETIKTSGYLCRRWEVSWENEKAEAWLDKMDKEGWKLVSTSNGLFIFHKDK